MGALVVGKALGESAEEVKMFVKVENGTAIQKKYGNSQTYRLPTTALQLSAARSAHSAAFSLRAAVGSTRWRPDFKKAVASPRSGPQRLLLRYSSFSRMLPRPPRQ